MERYQGQQTKVNEKDVLENIKKSSHVLQHQTDLSLLFDRIGDARIVMLSEASHGIHEFYSRRTFITQKVNGRKEFIIPQTYPFGE